jgi:heme-degrading monooxygenase HmoA
MWIRMGSFPVKAGQTAELSRVYNDSAVPKVRSYSGNLGCLLLEPTEPNGPFIVMTIWDSRAAADAYEASGAAAEIVAIAKPFFAGPPTLSAFESFSSAGLKTIRP